MEKEGENRDLEIAGLTPWEQHAAVINIPRFDYRAPNLLLERPHSGFLITCPIKREKSATKEAISILEKHFICSVSNGSKSSDPSNSHAIKRRKINLGEVEEECTSSAYEESVLHPLESSVVEASSHSTLKSEDIAREVNLSLVKLRKNGLLLFTFPCNDSQKAVDILINVLQSLEHGDMKSPQWCHRIFPIQETCSLKEKHLSEVVSRLVKMYLDNEEKKLEKPVKFAVGYDRRGLEEMGKKALQTSTKETNGLDLLDRNECFKIVAKAVKHVAVDSVVDLKSPEMIVLIELLPLSGVPNDSVVAGVSVLSHKLVATKPRLCVKTLLSDNKRK